MNFYRQHILDTFPIVKRKDEKKWGDYRTIIYEAPFGRCDREQDYATVWREFENRVRGAFAVNSAAP